MGDANGVKKTWFVCAELLDERFPEYVLMIHTLGARILMRVTSHTRKKQQCFRSFAFPFSLLLVQFRIELDRLVKLFITCYSRLNINSVLIIYSLVECIYIYIYIANLSVKF